jgi:hypothetical protein
VIKEANPVNTKKIISGIIQEAINTSKSQDEYDLA